MSAPAKDTTAPVLIIQGPDTIRVAVFGTYIPPKVISARDDVDGDLSSYVRNNNSVVNTSRLGRYRVVYQVSDLSGNTDSVIRIVNVIDTIRPSIKLVGAASQVISVKSTYPDSGVVVADNYQKELIVDTSGTFYQQFDRLRRYVTDTGTYTILYATADSSGNSVSITRTIHVKDMQAPVITLLGAEDTIVCRYAPYQDKGYEVIDNFESSSTLRIDTFGTFTNTLLPGYYTRYYVATDHAGNTARSEKRTIYVRPSDECMTGTDETAFASYAITVFPNPVSGICHINLQKAVQTNITLTDLTGKKIGASILAGNIGNSYTFDLSDVPGGIYLLRLQSAEFNITRKIIVAH